MKPAEDQKQLRFSDNVIVFGLAIGQILSFGVLFHSFSIFVKPMQAEFGWTVTQMTGAFTLGLFCADLFGIPVGHWVDRRGGRMVMAAGATGAAALLVFWSTVDSLAGFYALWLALGVAQSMSLGNVTAAVVTANIRDFRRGLTWVAILSGLSSISVVPVASLAVTHLGWRQGLLVLAAIQLLGPALIYGVILRGTVGSRTAEFKRREAALAEGRMPSAVMGPSPLQAAVRTPAFWLLAVACSVHWFVITGVLIHFLPLMQEWKVPSEIAVTVFAFNGPAAVVGRLALYYIDPGASAKKTGRLAFPVFGLGILILIYLAPLGLWGLALFALVYGMAAGVIMIVRQTAIAEIFGIRGYGAITGALTTVCILPRTMAPVSVAMLRDYFGAYDPVLWILFAVICVGTLAFWLAMAGRRRAD
ncbi:MAG: Major Facilitator Superfamily protein [Hyphomicrobiales bacterium]|nr:Major Facilitator Superfamily protein [Hyphomicrobiales bacterium]